LAATGRRRSKDAPRSVPREFDTHQFAPQYQKLNPKAVVPALVHDGNVIVESTVINEYLDETFPDVPLKPKSAVERAEMRVWTKAVG
jgi:ganglioside-induced differentiation-associated protein 1